MFEPPMARAVSSSRGLSAGTVRRARRLYVCTTTVAVDPSKTVESVTFPNVSNTVSGGATAMHIWAVSLGKT
jgi:hypothetical protein